MEVDFLANGLSEEGTFEVTNNIVQDGSTFEGERCGICMDIIIDRGVLDCCQHWFCFACIDNWATITNLCPLCQNEFQLITCVPVYDTIGSNKDEEDSFSRDDDWCIEGKNNTLSFPSYYIDENAVICLDGDGCKIRSGSATIGEVSNLDTSIACDSCDMWYHAFCVGFDPEGTCENTWLCPRCVVDELPQKSDIISMQRPDNHCGPEKADSESLVEDLFSGKMSVSVADTGETAVVVSMVGRSKLSEEPSENFLSTLEVDKDLKTERIMSITDASSPKADTQLAERNGSQPILEAEELELSLAHDTTSSLPPNSLVLSKLKTTCADEATNESSGINGAIFSSRKLFRNELSESESCIGLHLGLSVSSFLSVDNLNSGGTRDQVTGDALQHIPSEESLLKADKIVPEANDAAAGMIGVKRKHTDFSDDVHLSANNGETKDKIETEVLIKKIEIEVSAKKIRAEGNFQMIPSRDHANASDSDDSQKCPSLIAVSIDDKLKHDLKKEDVTSDIMSIVRGTGRRAPKGLANRNPADKSSEESESAAGLRVKKIMRRPAEDKNASMVVQKLRKEIREAIRNKTSKDIGEHLFDPKLLAAFRAAVAGPKTEPVKKLSPMAVKAKNSMLQKGKIRENLTKKIYGSSNGRRKRAWDRDCEVEFWKHRCIRASKPEKIETLKSVLDLLRKSSESLEIERGSEYQATNPILSRLYLADTSVFPRKDDIKPLTAFKATGNSEQSKEQSISVEKGLKPSLDNHAVKITETNKALSKVGISSIDDKGNKKNVSSSKGDAASSKEHPNRHPEGPALSPLGGSKVNSQKEMVVKSDTKSDKRKWALEVLARKTAATSRNATHEKQEDNADLKGNYPLLAQLPIDMRPVLAPSHHNKVPISVRQTQLYRLTEHFLRKANLPVIRRTADTELAVADAINIEKEAADRSNSKLVYVNLCSQELLHYSANSKSSRATELNPLPPSTGPVNGSEQATHELSTDPKNGSEQATNKLSTDPKVVEALRTAGLLPDSPPNSPLHKMEVPNEEDKPSKTGEEEPDNILEMDTLPELDIYGDFEYDLEDEDYIGATAIKISKIQPEEGVSKVKVLFSTLNSERSNGALHSEDHQSLGTVERPKDFPCVLQCGTAAGIRSSRMEDEADKLCAPPEPLLGVGGEEPSAAECEELYGPDKEPLIKKFPEEASTKLYGIGAEALAENKLPGSNETYESNQAVKVSEFGSQSYADTNIVATVGHSSSGGENSPNHSQAGENVQRKEKKSNTDQQPDGVNFVSKKVEAYIKEHIRPLCKSGVITAEQYRWAVAKATEKVMKYHCKAKNANFLIKEGEKVKKLAEQYAEAAQK